MEKKKIVLIAVIIGLFFFIALALPLSLLSSKEPTQRAVSGVPKPTEPSPVPMYIDESGTTPSSSQNIIINTYDGNGEIAASQTLPNEEGSDLTINVRTAPPTETPVRAVPSPAPAATQSTSQPAATTAPVRTPAPAPASSAPKEQPARVTKPAASAPKPVASASSSSPKTPAVTEYWIQTFSMSTQARAEVVKASLLDHGMSSVIENRTVNGQSVFRVRIGPYGTNAEAEYWLNLVKAIDSIDNLDESYISLTRR